MTPKQLILPQHVAIIMDGNGRWAKTKGAPRVAGHKAGVKRVKESIQFCIEKGIKVLSLFAFSSENWNRPQNEVSFLMELFMKSLNKELVSLHENGVHLRFTGQRGDFSGSLQKKMSEAENLTKHNRALVLNLVVNYGGKWDIVQATKQIARTVLEKKLCVDDIDETVVASFMSMSDLPLPDLFIRTSGEKRLSNFFLWQLAYAELHFCEVYWPDFTTACFEEALLAFSRRERRFGLISEQIA